MMGACSWCGTAATVLLATADARGPVATSSFDRADVAALIAICWLCFGLPELEPCLVSRRCVHRLRQ